jgi:hypothetical protein
VRQIFLQRAQWKRPHHLPRVFRSVEFLAIFNDSYIEPTVVQKPPAWKKVPRVWFYLDSTGTASTQFWNLDLVLVWVHTCSHHVPWGFGSGSVFSTVEFGRYEP